LETSQVWNDNWDESWDSAWNEGQEYWDESWSWPATDDQQASASAGAAAQGVQSLVLSPLISDVFASFATGLTLETDSSDETETVCSHFSCDETWDGIQQMHVAVVPNARLWHEMHDMIHLQCDADKTFSLHLANSVATQLPNQLQLHATLQHQFYLTVFPAT